MVLRSFLAVAALVAVLFLAAEPPAAQAQGTLLSNTGQADSPSDGYYAERFYADEPGARHFTTGLHGGGYEISPGTIIRSHAAGPPQGITETLRGAAPNSPEDLSAPVGATSVPRQTAAQAQTATVPDQVRGLVVETGNTEVILKWRAPDDGGSDITGYEYRFEPGGSWTSTGNTLIDSTITGLTNGQSYSFRVRAVNSVGSGPASYPVETVPGQPHRITDLAADPGAGKCELTLSWTAPGDNGSTIERYQFAIAEGYQSSYSDWMDISDSHLVSITEPPDVRNRSYTVDGLYAGTLYRFSVRAVNEHGKAESSNPPTARPAGPCGPPITYDLTATADDRQVFLKWNAGENSEDITAFQYRRKTGNAHWDDEQDTWRKIPKSGGGGVNHTSFTVAGLANKTRYRFQVRALYTTGSANKSDEVTATPFGRAAPIFGEGSSATRSVPEMTGTGQNVGSPVTASDADGDPLTYSLGGADAASVAIDAVSGQLTTVAPLDYEAESRYWVSVSVSDGKDDSGNADPAADANIQVTITVTNVDEPGEVTLSQQQPRVDAQFTATLTDPDGVTSGSAIWVWAASLEKNTWDDIDGAASSGYTPVAADGGKYLRVTASYSDGHGTGKSASEISTHPVQAPPVFPSAGTYARNVDEDTAPGQDIGNPVTATDANSDTLTYSLGGADASSFSIVSASGQLQTKATLDYEAKSVYTVTVAATDASNTSDEVTVTVNVTNLEKLGEVTLSQQQPQVGTALTATLQDADGNISDKTWGWESAGTQAGTYRDIDGAASAAYTPVAADVDQYLRATATYADGHGSRKSAQVVSASAVREAPVSNSAPAFPTSENGARSVPENTAAGQDIGAPMAAADPDASDTLTYSIGGTHAASFAIVASSGQLRTRAALNYEARNSYSVTVTATDPSSSTDAIAVTITVTDVNEPPEFPTGVGTRSVAENTPAGQNIGSPVAAADPDRGSALTYSLSGADSGSFTIVTTSGQLRTEDPLNRETKTSYSVIVSVRDGKDANGVTDTATDDTITVTVNVTDRNEPPGKPSVPAVGPASTGGHTALRVSWNAPSNRGPAITGYDVEYRKNGTGSWLNYNVIVSGTGAAISGVTPDSDYQARVRARNQEGAGPWSDPGSGRTAVTPVNLQVTLTVNYQSSSYNVTEGGSRSITVNLSAPADRALEVPITVANGTAEYGDYQVTGLRGNALSVAPGDNSGSFTLRALHDSDRTNETVSLGFGSLTNKVTAGARNTATVSITDDDLIVRTSDDDDDDDLEPGPPSKIDDSSTSGNQPPVFVEGVSARRSVPEHAKQAVSVGSPVVATDPDGDPLTYFLADMFDGKSFVIDNAWGQLITDAPLDFETKPTYTVVVGVSDGRGASDIMVVDINVADVQEAPIDNPQTQTIGKVNPHEETTIETPDGSASVTFPAGSRESSYQVRVDSAWSDCGIELPQEDLRADLRASLAVAYFDNWGNQEHDVVLDQPAAIRLRLTAAGLDGVDRVLAAHRRDGFDVFAHRRGGLRVFSSSDEEDEWSNAEFNLEADDQGIVTITVEGLQQLLCFAVATDAEAFAPVVQPTAGTPTPTPLPTAQPEQEPTPVPTSTPAPPAAPVENRLPAATPTIVPDVSKKLDPAPLVSSLIEDVSAAEDVTAPETPPDPVPEESKDTPLWPILMMIAGVTMVATCVGMYLVARRRRKAEGRP